MFTVIGEALLDMVQPSPGDLYRAFPAGGPLNIAMGLRRMGHPTAMMARFSRGALGRRVREYAADGGLDLSASVDGEQQATVAFATIDGRGCASYDFFVSDTSDWGWSRAELAAFPPESKALHTGSLATALDPGATHIADFWAERFHAGGRLLSFDPNIRPGPMGSREIARERVERFVATSHVVKASDEDLGWLYPGMDPVDAICSWAQAGPALTVLTRGPGGCVGATATGEVLTLGAPAIEVVDTIGAGDAFQAGLLSALADADRLTPTGVASLTSDGVRRVLQRALVVAAMTCGRSGANPPTRAEYEAQGDFVLAAEPGGPAS